MYMLKYKNTVQSARRRRTLPDVAKIVRNIARRWQAVRNRARYRQARLRQLQEI